MILEKSILELRTEFLIARLIWDDIVLPKNSAMELVSQYNDDEAYRKAMELEETPFSFWMKSKWSKMVNLIQR
jgi:hypothetical protein